MALTREQHPNQEVEGQKVAPINTDNGAFPGVVVAMGKTELAPVGHIDNEIVGDGKHIRPKRML